MPASKKIVYQEIPEQILVAKALGEGREYEYFYDPVRRVFIVKWITDEEK